MNTILKYYISKGNAYKMNYTIFLGMGGFEPQKSTLIHGPGHRCPYRTGGNE